MSIPAQISFRNFDRSDAVEERIQEMLERKREVAANLLSAGEGWITELSNEELRRLLTLDRSEALE